VSDLLTFEQLIARLRKGDADAAAELVRQYEPVVRRALRFRLRFEPEMHRLFDSMDICQSVLASFFVGAACGRYDLDTQADLLTLLISMARNKFISTWRKHKATSRDAGQVRDLANHDVITSAPGPVEQVEVRELLQEIRRRLDPDELRLVELRNQGHDWASIAEQVGGNPVALRQQLHRALARLSKQFELEEDDHE
jgi:RNA polymerase sigma factor (sigma-70 family)